jgi:hypothetical protein
MTDIRLNFSTFAITESVDQSTSQVDRGEQRNPQSWLSPATRRPAWLRNQILWVSIAAVGLAALFARLPLLHLNDGAVGGDLDGYNNIWDYFWLKTALLDLHQNPYYTNYIYYPTGVSLRFHTFNPLNGLITMPFNLAFGYIPTFNLIFFFAPVLTLIFSFLLMRDWVGIGSPWAAFAGAVVATYVDYHVSVFLVEGQSSYITLQWIPLYFFFVFRAARGRPLWGANNELLGYDARRWPLYAALSVLTLLLLTLTDWQFLMLVVFATLLYGAYVLFTHNTWREKGIKFARLAVVGGVYAAIVAFPLLIPMIQESAGNPWLDVSYQSVLHSVDLGWLLNPGIGLHGIVVFALAAIGVWITLRPGRNPRGEAAYWLLVIAFFYLMSFGPELIVNGHATGIPSLYTLMQNLPVISSGRDPARFTIIATIGVSVFFALGVRWLLGRLPRLRIVPRVAWALPAAAVIALLAAPVGAVIAQTDRATIDPPLFPEFYKQLAQDKDTYAILELPIFSDSGLGADHYQMYQLLHQKLRFSGRLARDRKLTNPNNFVKTSSLFNDLWLLGLPADYRALYYPKEDILHKTDYATQGLAILNYYKVRYIVVYKSALSDTRQNWDEQGFQSILRQVFGQTPSVYYEDQAMRVYKVPDAPLAANPLTLDTGDGWYKSEKRADGLVYRWADLADSPAAELYTMNLSQQPIRAHLSFTARPYQAARTLQVTLDGAPVTSFQLKPEKGDTPFSVDLTLTSGNHIIGFTSPEPSETTNIPSDARLLSFAMYNVQLQEAAR